MRRRVIREGVRGREAGLTNDTVAVRLREQSSKLAFSYLSHGV